MSTIKVANILHPSATTAAIKLASDGTGGIAALTVNAQSGTTYTFVGDDAGKLVTASNASAKTLTIPPQSSVTWAAGAVLRVVNYGAGALTVDGGSGVTVTNTASTVAQYSSAAAIRTAEDAWTLIPFGGVSGPFDVDFLVVAGGGGGGYNNGGGGGAGGLRSSTSVTGGGGSLETTLSLAAGVYTVTVGAGGVASVAGVSGAGNGADSVFSTVTSTGGGAGASVSANGSAGGSGGGSADGSVNKTGGAGTANQGYAGGSSLTPGPTGAGGGGAGGAGADGTGGGGNKLGGVGVSNNITGSSVTYAVGGIGARTIAPVPGAANTGGGGVGHSGGATSGAAGGSGVVIFTLNSLVGATFSGGVTQTNTTVGGNKVYTVTAAGPTDTVTIG